MKDDRATGSIYAILAFTFWGMIPLYFKAVASVPSLEMLAHRALWVLLTLWPLIVIMGWGRRILSVFLDKATLRPIMLSTSLLTVNWLIMIWAVAEGYVLETSLGYYINPLLNVILGVVVLGEKLRPLQWVAVGLAILGIAVMIGVVGVFPWIALGLAFTFALYGFVRKRASVDAVSGLFAESILVMPLVIGYLGWLWIAPGNEGVPVVVPQWESLTFIVAMSGIVTALPLVAFTEAARKLPLSMLGFFQYITPTGHFILAVFVFKEPFSSMHLVSFSFIWAALSIYTFDIMKNHRRTLESKAT